MRYRDLLVFITMAGLFSCKKDKETVHQPLPVPSGSTEVVPKDLATLNFLPPYYQFEYNPAGEPEFAPFASAWNRNDIMCFGNVVNCIYSDSKTPSKKIAEVSSTNKANAGLTFETQSMFSYY